MEKNSRNLAQRKPHFPGLLSRLYSHLKPENLVAGFKASGIFPLDRQECLKCVPDVNKDIFNDTVLDMLKKHCAPVTKGPMKRGKNIDVTPGRPITVADIKNNDSDASPSNNAARQVDVEVEPDESASDSQVESTDGELTSDGDSETVSGN